MKLSEIKGDAALECLADIIEPAVAIIGDAEIVEALQGANKLVAVKKILKTYKKEVVEILAALDGVPADEYEVSVLSLPFKLLEILNDKELVKLFQSAEQTGGAKSSASALENIEA